MVDKKPTDLKERAESKERKRLIISYMNSAEASNTIDCFKREAKKFSDDYVATLQHLLETGQPNLAEALLYGEVQELKSEIEAIKQELASKKEDTTGPKTFGRK